MLWKSGGIGHPQRPLTLCGSTPATAHSPRLRWLRRPTARKSSLFMTVSFDMHGVLKKFLYINKFGGGGLPVAVRRVQWMRP
jgi:hypothetical protein